MTQVRRIASWIALSISTTLFSGFLPGKILGTPGKAGGFAGAFVALILQFALLTCSWIVPASICVGSFIVGTGVIKRAEHFMLASWGTRRRHTGKIVVSDFNETNIDEFHGQLLAGLPAWLLVSQTEMRVTALVAAFTVFRIFDTWKPWPIRNIERFFGSTGFGIMIDDTIAALPGALACLLVMAV